MRTLFWRFSFCLAVISLITFGCATSEIRSQFQKVFEQREQYVPRPYPCDPGYLNITPDGYVGHITEWAEPAGLRRGDRITSIAGVPVARPEERARALSQVPVGGPLVMVVERDKATMTISLPCKDNSRGWAALGRLLGAGASGDWEGCDIAARELRSLRGRADPLTVWYQYQCTLGKRRASLLRRNVDAQEANLLYEHNILVIRDSYYLPGGIDQMRGYVLTNASHLRANGFGSLAADLEAELQRAVRGEVRPPPSAPGTTESAVSRGTGFVVRSDGFVLTAFHVVKDAKVITVQCPGRSPATATAGETAASNDLAVLRTSQSDLPYLSLAAPRSLRVGEPVFTIGFPITELLGTESKFTDGSVSALSGVGGEATLIQITVPVQPGNSGGPLLNDNGEVVGMVTSTAAIRPFLRATGTLPQNVNWAVKSEYATPLFDQPPPLPRAAGRREAVTRAINATCVVEGKR